MIEIAIWVVSGILLLSLLLDMFVVTDHQTVNVIERFGNFKRMANPGLSFKIPIIDSIADTLSKRVSDIEVQVETKTRDNVFVTMKIAVQYFVKDPYKAAYELENPESQIEAYVNDVIRSRAPKIELDTLFEDKDDLNSAVRERLSDALEKFGFELVTTLVTDIIPDSEVIRSMNRINASKRDRISAEEEAQAQKIRVVRAAEAEAESKKLQGEGIANQRKAIVEGLRESIQEFGKAIDGSSAQDVMNLVMMTQYFDTLKEIGAQDKSHTILVPHSPGGMAGFGNEILQAMLLGKEQVKE